jgi:hypothetical protein
MARLRASEPPERPAYWLDDQHQDETLEETVDEESTT